MSNENCRERMFENLFDQPPIKCFICGQTDISRSDFGDHVQKLCPKLVVSCPAADIRCPWKGQRNQLNQHLDECCFESLRPIITEFLAENQQLNDQVNRQAIEIAVEENNIEELLARQEQLLSEIERQQIEKQQLKDQINQLTIRIDEQENMIVRQQQQVEQQTVPNSRHQSWIRKFKEQIGWLPTGQLNTSNISINTKWIQNGIVVAGGNGLGDNLNQLSNPSKICVTDEQTVYVLDCWNHRVVEWKNGATNGQVVAGGRGLGCGNNQFTRPMHVIIDKKNDSLIVSDPSNDRVMRWPRENGTTGEPIISNFRCWGLAIDKHGCLYTSDVTNSEVRRWKIGETNGTLVAGGNGKGNSLNQLSNPYYIFVDQDESVYISDMDNHRVMKWIKGAKEGIVVAGGSGQGNKLTQLSSPKGVIVDELGTVYIADCYNHRIMRWLKGATEGSVIIGGNGKGNQANQLNYPVDLSFDRQNNLYIVNNENNDVQKFLIDSSN